MYTKLQALIMQRRNTCFGDCGILWLVITLIDILWLAVVQSIHACAVFVASLVSQLLPPAMNAENHGVSTIILSNSGFYT